MVVIEIQTKDLIPHLEHVLLDIKNGVPRVLAPAINRSLSAGKTSVKREIRKTYAIKAKDIPATVHNATRASLEGKLVIQQGMIDLNKFPFRPRQPNTGRMLNVEVKRGKRRDIPHGFVQRMPNSGYLGPFIRKGKARLPIRKLTTISAAIMAAQPSVVPVVEMVMTDTLDKRLDHELERVLASAGK